MRTAYADFFSNIHDLQVFCLDSNHRLKHPLSAKTALLKFRLYIWNNKMHIELHTRCLNFSKL